MRTLFEKAVSEVSKLSPEAQDAIGTIILEVLEDEARWDAQFAASQDELSRLADAVRADISAGRVKRASFDAR